MPTHLLIRDDHSKHVHASHLIESISAARSVLSLKRIARRKLKPGLHYGGNRTVLNTRAAAMFRREQLTRSAGQWFCKPCLVYPEDVCGVCQVNYVAIVSCSFLEQVRMPRTLTLLASDLKLTPTCLSLASVLKPYHLGCNACGYTKIVRCSIHGVIVAVKGKYYYWQNPICRYLGGSSITNYANKAGILSSAMPFLLEVHFTLGLVSRSWQWWQGKC